MIDLQYRPMKDTAWKRPSDQRRSSQFSAEWGSTLKLLKTEVDHVEGTDLTIMLEVLPHQIRVDGTGLKANQEPASPAVVVTMESVNGPLTFQADAYMSRSWGSSRAGWKQNVRAVALTMAALRAVERYGASDRGQQYAGYLAIEAGSSDATALSAGLTTDEARQLLVSHSHLRDDVAVDYQLSELYRIAMRNSHPDRHNGDQANWNVVQDAARRLGLR